jgi:ABC-type molybdate transport system permease subunit
MTEVEHWLVLISAVAAVIPWAFSIHAKVAVIASAVEHLPAMVQELRDALAEHETRLDQHETEIATLKASTRPSH